MSIESAFLRAGVPAHIAHAEAPRAQAAMLEHDITDQARARDFLAQVLHESVLLQFFEEIADGSAYEGRRDLGNTHPGDGRRFKGRGPIQLTGRANYRWAGRLLHLPLEAHPGLASRHDVGWRIAGLYWQAHGLNGLADRNNFVRETMVINGGTNGLASRLHLRSVCGAVDCRPRRPDPYKYLNARERHLCQRLDKLKTGPERHKVKLEAIKARKRIWQSAQPKSKGGDGRGWHKWHRLERYHALMKRTR